MQRLEKQASLNAKLRMLTLHQPNEWHKVDRQVPQGIKIVAAILQTFLVHIVDEDRESVDDDGFGHGADLVTLA